MRAAISPLLSARSRRETYFPHELSHRNGPDLFRAHRLLVMCGALFRDVCENFLRFRQLSNPLVVIEQLRGGVLLFLQEHELRVEEESAFFCKVNSSRQTPPLSGSCEGDEPQATRAASAHSALVG